MPDNTVYTVEGELLRRTLERMSFIKHAIREQLGERNAVYPEQAPAMQWRPATDYLSYVLDLPDEHLMNVRLHCDVFLGVLTPARLYMSGIVPSPDDHDRSFAYTWLGEGAPRAHWASEPPVPGLNGWPLGAPIGDYLVTDVTAWLQRYACNLARLGLADGDHVVEIGAGHGGLAQTLLAARPRLRYTIIDLPETLLFSAAFLATHFPGREIYIYRPGDRPDAIDWTSYDIVLLPNYRADWLRDMPRSQWAVNTVSFPEMAREQLRGYVDLLADTLDGVLMSVNYCGVHHDDGKGVEDFLAERFALHPSPDDIKSSLSLNEAQYADQNFRPTIVCVPPTYDLSKFDGAEIRDVSNGRHFTTVIKGAAAAVRDATADVAAHYAKTPEANLKRAFFRAQDDALAGAANEDYAVILSDADGRACANFFHFGPDGGWRQQLVSDASWPAALPLRSDQHQDEARAVVMNYLTAVNDAASDATLRAFFASDEAFAAAATSGDRSGGMMYDVKTCFAQNGLVVAYADVFSSVRGEQGRQLDIFVVNADKIAAHLAWRAEIAPRA